MKNPDTTKKIYAVLIAAILGAALFVILTLGVITHYFALEAGFIMGMPTLIISKLFGLGLENAPASDFMNSGTFETIVNGILGAFVFGITTVIWQFIVKGSHEK